MRIAVDTGGTFTDLIIEDGAGRLKVFKAATTPDDPSIGIFNALRDAAEDAALSVNSLLLSTENFVHATTRAINAVLTGSTARTAFLTTEGHRDILLFREGGRIEIFNFSVEYPDPYVPRSLTFEVPERIAYDGTIVTPLDEASLTPIFSELRDRGVEAVGVCLLWSTVNPVHETRIGQLLQRELPGVDYTLSHAVNPTLREYRRASSTCIDASLKPIMSEYLHELHRRLTESGFAGRFLMVTSQGGVKDSAIVADAPIHAINSGPAMAPVGGCHYARVDSDADTAIVADAGGTSFDVSLVRDGRIPWTRETWLGEPYRGHMTGFPSIDVKSIGAGGGSIAWVDSGGMLHVGPDSAGADPGPVCYGQGGTRPTITDAALVSGLLDPDYFLGGRMPLDVGASRVTIERDVARPLGISVERAAQAMMDVLTENMVQAIEGVTVQQGVDPRLAVLVAGGGAAGLNAVAIARRLGNRDVVVPGVGAVLSAAGSMMADLGDDFSATLPTTGAAFDRDAVNRILEDLERRCAAFTRGPGKGALSHETTFFAEARYSHQVWEIEVPLRKVRFETIADVDNLVDDFHAAHEAAFAVRDPASDIELIHWHARVRCKLRSGATARPEDDVQRVRRSSVRRVVFPGVGAADATVLKFDSLQVGESRTGPAIVESPFTSVAIEPDVQFKRTAGGSLRVALLRAGDDDAARVSARRW